ncbi:MAG: TIGR03960 family B12-binding radical SAM protein [Deltaproteobacteria bacterium]|nr:TIGR03960 family B12-binding radical SAM protein [Deltaproteobacteria bacterium]
MAKQQPVAQATIDSLIINVDKPARYTGGEVNSVVKAGPVAARLALVFPDVYEVAESHLGFKILYEIVNDHADYAAERVYAMWPDLEARARAAHVPLWSLETHLPLCAFDVVGVTLQYELAYPTIVAMLEQGGVPVRTAARHDDDPIVVGGGICAFNPEPIAPFFDAFLLGDGERAVLEILDVVARGRKAQKPRAEILCDLAGLDGVYVPSHFEVQYDGLRVTAIHARPGTPHADDESKHHTPRVKRAVVSDLDRAQFYTRPIVPSVQPVHERVAIEIQRGCSRSCRFCQPGMVTRPTRQRRAQTVQELAAQGLAASGCDTVGLLSLSAGDYGPINEVVSGVLARHDKDKVGVSLPSLRSETMTPELAARLASSSGSGFTLAPEAGSERLRRVINKTSTEEDLLAAVATTIERGWRNLKLYFMMGLPTETDADLEAILVLAERAQDAAHRVRRDANITVAVSTFVPKPHTPFQWEAQIGIDETRRRHRYLREALRKRRITLRYHSPEQSFLEGVLSRGDRRLADGIETAAKLGARLDAWTELFDLGRWMQGFREALAPSGLTPESYLERRDVDGLLAWDHLDAGPTKHFLRRDRERAVAEEYLEDCAFSDQCHVCGACDLGDVYRAKVAKRGEGVLEPRTYKAGNASVVVPPSVEAKAAGPTPARSRLRFRFAKEGRAVHLSQLDTLNQVLRAVRQSGLPVLYSEGHVPRPKVGFSPACPTGIASRAEYFEADCRGFPDPEKYAGVLNRWLPDGVRVLEAVEISRDTPSFNEIIRTTTYLVEVPSAAEVATRLAAFAERPELLVRVIRKGKPRILDAKACIDAAVAVAGGLQIRLGFSRFGTIKIGEAIAALLGPDAVHSARIRKEAVELGAEPLSHEEPERLQAHGEVLDLTAVSERRAPEAPPAQREGHVPFAE